MRKYIQEFYESNDCVYTYSYYCAGDYDWIHDREIYESVGACFEELFYSLDEEEKDGFIDIRITRRSLLKEKRNIEVRFNKDKKILKIDACDETDEERGLTKKFFEGMWY